MWSIVIMWSTAVVMEWSLSSVAVVKSVAVFQWRANLHYFAVPVSLVTAVSFLVAHCMLSVYEVGHVTTASHGTCDTEHPDTVCV